MQDRFATRDFTIEDNAFVLDLLNSPGWLAFIGDKQVKTDEDAVRYIKDGPLTHYKTPGMGLRVIEDKKTKSPVGVCGLLKRDYLDFPDLGYALLPGYEGLGIVAQIASRLLRNIRIEKSHQQILAMTNPQNIRSINVLVRLGFHLMSQMNRKGEEINIYQKIL